MRVHRHVESVSIDVGSEEIFGAVGIEVRRVAGVIADVTESQDDDKPQDEILHLIINVSTGDYLC